jgi:NADPH2:quinone reductase
VPKGLDMVQAAALPETFFTVWQNMFDRGRLAAGETVLIHGGSSGIGTAAIQMAKATGARVLATAGSAEKCAACVKLGADRAIDYKTEDFVAAAKAETGGKGVDLILDMIGGKYLPRNLAALAIEGRLSLIALLGGREATIDLSLVLRKRLTIVGSVLRARTVAEKGLVAQSLRRAIWPAIEAGRIAPVIDSTFPFAEAEKAHARMESSAHIGKIVLTA